MADALIGLIRSMTPEKLAADLGSEAFVKTGFDPISMALNALDVDQHTPGIVLLLYVSLFADYYGLVSWNQAMSRPFPS